MRSRRRKTRASYLMLATGIIIGLLIAGPIRYDGIIRELQEQLTNGEGDIPPTGDLTIAGSSTLLPITQECANLFMEENPLTYISVAGGGSGHGVKAAGSGEIDIGQSSRNVKDSELLRYPDLVLFSIGKDSVAVIINSNNPLAGTLDLSLDEIGDIFSGEITNWRELGGDDHEIEVYTREEGSGTREVFSNYVLGDRRFISSASVKPSNGEMRASVANNVYGISYVSLGYVDETVSAIIVDGAEATVENVQNGQYPITRILWVFTRGMPSKLEAEFIKYIQGPEGQVVVEELGYIPIY